MEKSLYQHNYDWTSYFPTTYKKIIGIKKYHHFNFDATSPGKVNVRCAHDGPVTTLNILKVDAELVNDDLPAVVPPKGLSNERQWYLYDKIRQYCREECKDFTCPLPESPRPAGSSRQSTPGIDEEPEIGMEIEVPLAIDSSEPTRRKRQCGNCGQYGHNRRRCPNNQ